MLVTFLKVLVEIIAIPYILMLSLYSRFFIKNKLIGIGPQNLISSVYHKKSLEFYGYISETFTYSPSYITDRFDLILNCQKCPIKAFKELVIFIKLISISHRYNVIYITFRGGPIGFSSKILWKIEPFFYKVSRTKIVVFPYGSDVQDMTKSENIYFKHALSMDYPNSIKRSKLVSSKVLLWSEYADHIISGCEWVDYMPGWDTLMPGHFAISAQDKVNYHSKKTKTFKILHAPNHSNVKGSEFVKKAVKELINEGYDIELELLIGVNNDTVLNKIESADLIADQFVIGWYAMFSIEAMMLGKPVLCYLRDDLISLYVKSNTIVFEDLPIINTKIDEIKDKIIWSYNNQNSLKEIGKKSIEYVDKYHSTRAIGKILDSIHKNL
jgi:glycosyltransferase involved in cell wall biosynthesis